MREPWPDLICSPLEEYAAEIVGLIEEQRDWTLDEFVAAMRKLGARKGGHPYRT